MALGVGLAGAIFTTIHARGHALALFDGVDAGFLAASGAAILGAATSAIRGGQTQA